MIAAAPVAAIVAVQALGLRHPARVQVTTATITTGPVVRHIIASGTLQALTTVAVGSQVSGAIQSLAVDYNSIVHAGEVVARIDPALFQAAFNEATASLDEAQAALLTAQADRNGAATAVEDARTKLQRAEQLAARQLIPQSDLDAARIAMDEASANLESATSQVTVARAATDQARAAVAQARVNLDHTTITSPVDGIVIARNVDVGQTVAAAVQAPVLFNIATDLRQMQLELDLDEADIAGVQPGEPVSFQVESYPDKTFTGTIAAIHLQPVVDQTTGTSSAASGSLLTAAPSTPTASSTSVATAPSVSGTVVSYATIVDVANPDEELRPGMTATVALTGAHRDNALRVPSAALSFRPPLSVLTAIGEAPTVLSTIERSADSRTWRLWRYNGSQFTPVDVRVGLSDREWTELLGGSLQPGDTVVTSAAITR